MINTFDYSAVDSYMNEQVKRSQKRPDVRHLKTIDHTQLIRVLNGQSLR